MLVARKFIISGLVQGVGFRFFTQRTAARHQVRGYVKNLTDGRVETFVEGNEKSVENFKHDLIAGPTYSNVEHIEEIVLEPTNLYSSFRIEKITMDHLRKLIREVPDFPKAGINFYDITTLLKDAEGLKQTIDALAEQFKGERIDTVIGVESRGFIFAAPLAYHLKAGFVPVRKPKKLPAEKVSVSYDLEYGQDTLEIHKDAIGEGHRVLIVDDLLATGGTAKAVVDLVEGLNGKIVGLLFLVELDFLNGRQKFDGYDVRSLIRYDS